VASAGAPVYGSVTVTGSPAKLAAASTVCPTALTIYPDPTLLVYVGGSGVTAAVGPGNFALQPGGAPLLIQGSIDATNVYVIASSGSPVVGYVGQ
jgi:hypothetical protein